MSQKFENYLLQVTKAKDCKEVEIIQSLWSDYGKISRYQLIGSKTETVVVKHVALNQFTKHPRGWNSLNSHNRKVKSYKVERSWYKHWSGIVQNSRVRCKIPEYFGSFEEGENQWIILEDLNNGYPIGKQQISQFEVRACLKWLANFHTAFLDYKPNGLWNVGTYWHLETRPDELKKIEHNRLKVKAPVIDNMLNSCTYQTIVHGDAKLANFCFSENGIDVAAVDFQYVGGGCGMKDVAYFLGSCLSAIELESFEKELLDFYFEELKRAIESTSQNTNFTELEREWRYMYPIASADFVRFLMGWMPTHQKLNSYNQKMMEDVLGKLGE